MAITRFDPFRDLAVLQDRMNRMFNDSFVNRGGDEALLNRGTWTPAVDIQETPEAYFVHAELPDVKKDDVKVTVQNGVLLLTGERRQEKEEKGKKFHRVERSYGSFLRSFALPENVDDGKLSAEFKDGVLNVRLPKTEKAKPKAIAVKVS